MKIGKFSLCPYAREHSLKKTFYLAGITVMHVCYVLVLLTLRSNIFCILRGKEKTYLRNQGLIILFGTCKIHILTAMGVTSPYEKEW